MTAPKPSPSDSSAAPSAAPSVDPGIARRLQSLEEAVGFAEHAAERHAADVLELTRGVAALAARVAQLERRLAALLAPMEGDASGGGLGDAAGGRSRGPSGEGGPNADA